jgi:phosphatidate cytidylyltransferase
VAGVLADATRSRQIGPRLAAAAILMPTAIGLTWAGGIAFALLILGCAGLIAREWARLCGTEPDSPAALVLIVGCVGIGALAFASGRYDAGVVAGIVLYGLLRALPAAGRSRRSRLWLATGALAILPACLSALWLRTVPADGFQQLAWLFAVVWMSDSAAFFVGRAIGGPRLAPTISPAKTWAGLIGGLAGAAAVGFILGFILTGRAMPLAGLTGLILGLAGGAGDLFESLMKRRFQAKDSGGLIPGHGGFLDRLDSFLAAAPVAVCLYLAGWRWL